MTVFWKPWQNIFSICLVLCTTAVLSAQFQLQPLNSTVQQGSDARFIATVQGNWQIMTWTVRQIMVLTIPAGGNTTSFSPQFSARFCSSGNTSCVEFTIHNVTRRESGPVICTMLGEYGSKTAQLHVEESGTVNIMEGNMTVIQDQEVKFQCVATAWFPTPTISWTRNGQAINSNLYNTTSMADGDSFNSTSVLTFQAISNTTVECQATVQTLTKPQSSSVFLVVVPKPPNWTVLIAVVVSFGGFALLILLIIGLIFCYKRRKKKQPNYQDEMRRVRTQSQIQGEPNAAYVPEGETSVPPTELTDSSFCQPNSSDICKMPDVISSNQAGNSNNSTHNTVHESGVNKHRHVTIV
ncbi:immunoglobulin superfamily member 5 isoform X2 [Mastacembelus armatus]|nr:immunoglobulin superfamily member 5 isoform X2 [Mastacembelus armatus]